MVRKQGCADLKFGDQHNQIIHDANWIAGVDYKQNDEEDNDDDDYLYWSQADHEDLNEGFQEIDPEEVNKLLCEAVLKT